MHQKMIFKNLQRIRYKEAWDYQKMLFSELIEAKKNNQKPSHQYLLFCEHEPVFTLGKSGNKQNLLITEHICKAKQIDFFPINRGGDITYHGPGQLVVYPIIDMESFQMGVKQYIHALEQVVIDTLQEYNITATRDEKAIGVWIDSDNPIQARKICAIGVKTSRYVTMHGLALNINTDLSYFNFINPCGFIDKGVTSIQKELGHTINFEEVATKMKVHFARIFRMDFS